MNVDNLISVAAVVQNDEKIVESYVEDVINELKKSFENYELVLIDNGSSDNSVSIIKKLQRKIENIRLIILSRKNEDEIAYTAALNNCIGDFVVLMDMNYDPPALIPQLVDKSISGCDLVIAERNDRGEKSLFEKILISIFFKISKFFTGYNINPRLSKYIVFSRRAVNSIIRIKDRSRYIKFLAFEVGYSHGTVPYARINRGNYPKKSNLLKSVPFAIEVIVSNSDRLIRTASFLGLMASLLNLAYAFYVLLGFIFFSQYIPQGWTSTQLANATMFFLLFLILSITGEYIARILRETKKGELYYVADELNSSVFPGNIDKKNVLTEESEDQDNPAMSPSEISK